MAACGGDHEDSKSVMSSLYSGVEEVYYFCIIVSYDPGSVILSGNACAGGESFVLHCAVDVCLLSLKPL